MTAIHVLFYLRLFEVSIMLALFWWIIHHSTPSRFRTLRLAILSGLTLLNFVAVCVAVFWAKVTLW